jgi:hypothetical protein
MTISFLPDAHWNDDREIVSTRWTNRTGSHARFQRKLLMITLETEQTLSLANQY